MIDKSEHKEKIAAAIRYIKANFKSQPGLEELANVVHMSPHHFQKVFSAWVGISPKQFLRFVSLDYAKRILSDSKLNLLDTSYKTGLSGSGRLHDLFVRIEAMSPGEYKQGGSGLKIDVGCYDSLFGRVIIGSTDRGICHLAFYEDEEGAFDTLKRKFPGAGLKLQQQVPIHLEVQSFLQCRLQNAVPLKLHLKGTPFQIKVWEALLKIPEGRFETYGKLAQSIGHEKSGRAVGTAIGSNPVAWLIPCHRVIRGDGHPGGYHWGIHRKMDMLDFEMGQVFGNEE